MLGSAQRKPALCSAHELKKRTLTHVLLLYWPQATASSDIARFRRPHLLPCRREAQVDKVKPSSRIRWRFFGLMNKDSVSVWVSDLWRGRLAVPGWYSCMHYSISVQVKTHKWLTTNVIISSMAWRRTVLPEKKWHRCIMIFVLYGMPLWMNVFSGMIVWAAFSTAVV